MRKDDLTGRRFGRLFVVSENPVRGNSRQVRWNCRCDCGAEKVITAGNLRSGGTVSCGCYLHERLVELRTTHGWSHSKAYTSWKEMMRRCSDPAAINYAEYGGRGIKVCERWGDFSVFLSDMGEPRDRESIDRIDVNDGYHPGNCRWANPVMQSRNTRRHLAEDVGVFQRPSGNYTAGIHCNGVQHWLGTFATKEEAIAARKAAEIKYWADV